MRTRFELVLADRRDPGALRAAGEEALEEIARVENELSPFREGSSLARINAAAGREPVPVDGLVFRFLERCQALSEALDGAFDPTVGALLERLRRGPTVSEEELAAAQSRTGFARQVRLDSRAQTVALTAGTRLDPGAIGKGWALERAAGVLRDAGIASALLHGGTSSVYALGAPPGEAGWMVAVQDPGTPEHRLARVCLRDQALGVSAIHGRTFLRGQERVGHVVDPRGGASVSHTTLAAVVMASPTDADAASTALLVLGEAAMERLAPRFSAASFLTVSPARVATAGAAFIVTERGPYRKRGGRRRAAARRVP